MELEAPYKALVDVRWRNRITRTIASVAAGTVLTFDDGDFDLPDGPRTAALRSLDDALARGLFAPYDVRTAGDPDYMSRDEMLNVLRGAGLADGLSHAASPDQLRPLVVDYLAGVHAEAPAEPVRDVKFAKRKRTES